MFILKYFPTKRLKIKIIKICFIVFAFLIAFGLNVANAIDPHFGVTCHFQADSDLVKKDLDLMKEAGIGWRRVNLNWSRYEKDKTYLDKAIIEANKRNINILVMIIMGEYSVFPEQGVKSKRFRKSIQDFEKFVAEVSERYDGDSIKDAPGSPLIEYWQIENEETGPGHFWKRKKFSKKPGPAEKYVEVLKTAYKAIKTNQPNAKVVLGGLGGYDRKNYLEGILKADGGKYFDILDFHIYLDFPSFWNVLKVDKRVDKFREQLKRFGFSKPIWATEMTTGQQALKKEKTLEDKEKVLAELVVKRYAVLLSEGVEKAFWKYFDTPKVPGGILKADLSLRPAYKAYGTMIKKIGGFSEVRDMSKEDLKIFKFICDKKDVFIVWAEQKQTVDIGFKRIYVTDMFGKMIVTNAPFIIDRSPVYVEKAI